MKYFTPQLYERLQNFDPAAMAAADAEWEAASQRYEQHLEQLGAALVPVLKNFEGILLHDAVVLGISRRGDQFSIVLLKDIPLRDAVTLTYTLTDEPFIDRTAVASRACSAAMLYEYDEWDIFEGNGQTYFSHSILFSNGWEIRLRFRDVQVTLALPIYPLPPTSISALTASA